jgi:hypothetical protein
VKEINQTAKNKIQRKTKSTNFHQIPTNFHWDVVNLKVIAIFG